MKGKFLGDTKGNRDLHCNRSSGELGGSGEAHKAFSHNNKFLGSTKGNRDLPTNRSEGVKQGGYRGR